MALEPPKVVPPPQAAKSILLKVQVLLLPEAKLKENNKGKMPPKVFVVPASPQSVANLVKLGGNVIAEPTLVTTDDRVASFLKGGRERPGPNDDGTIPRGEFPAKRTEPNVSHVEWLRFGTRLEFHPRILPDGKISLKFRFEQEGLDEESPRDKFATELSGAVLTSGFVSEGVATLKEGESVFATVPFAKSVAKENGSQVFIMFFTPEIMEDPNVQPASATLPTEAQSVPVVEIETRPARVSKLQGDRRAALVLEVSETGYLESPDNIRSVKVTSGRKGIAAVTAEGNQRLLIQGKQVGDVMLVVADTNGEQYEALVQVKPATGTDAVQDTLNRLFPDAQIEVTAINESLLLRGVLANEGDLIKITEIAEQFAPKVLNHLQVAPAQVIPSKPTTTPRAPSMALPAPLPPHPSKERTEFDDLRADVKALRQDVKHMIEILERKAAAKPKASSNLFRVEPDPAPFYHQPKPTAPIAPYPPLTAPTPLPSGASYEPDTLPNPAYLPTPLPSSSPYGPPQPSVELLPNHTGPNPAKALPNHAGPNPVLPIPKNQTGWSEPYLPTPPSVQMEPPKDPLLTTSAEATEDRVETKPLLDDLDPSAFVSVRTVKLSAPEDLGHSVPMSVGSGVVIESDSGHSVILTGAHLLKDYEPGKDVLQVGAAYQIDDDGKARRLAGPYPATIILKDDQADIALLRAEVPVKLGTISVSRHGLPKMQERVRCIGFPKDGDRTPRFVSAKVVEINQYQGPDHFEFAGLIPNGFSGAAVLDESRKLIGIATAVDPKDNRTLCIPAAEIRKVFARFEDSAETVTTPGLDLAKRYFGSQSWAASANFILHRNGWFLYFNEWSSDHGKTVQFKPFAMIRIPKSGVVDEKRVGIICDSATFQFDETFL